MADANRIPSYSSEPKADCASEDDAISLFDPMGIDYMWGIGSGNDFTANDSLTHEKLPRKFTPCKFHDGVSGSCWKGKECRYSHEKYTGGVFSEKNPNVAAAADKCREVSTVLTLGEKPILNKGAFIKCRVTHVVSPSEFYIRPTDGYECVCKHINDLVQKAKLESKAKMGSSGLDGLQHEDFEERKKLLPTLSTTSDKLQKFLEPKLLYRKYQFALYFPKVELVAVCVNFTWMRAIVLSCESEVDTIMVPAKVRVQLLDTGKKITIESRYVCRLPDLFCYDHAEAFKCCIYGISPVWLVWHDSSVELFKKMVENKDLVINIKDPVCRRTHGDFKVFEPRPHLVSIMIENHGTGIDVADELMELGYALRWSPLFGQQDKQKNQTP